MIILKTIKDIVGEISKNNIVILPTESVYGFSSIVNKENTKKICDLKKRKINKPFILVYSDTDQLNGIVDFKKLTSNEYDILCKPSENTLIVPAITNSTIAVRKTKNKLLNAVCNELQSAIISTSANISGKLATKNADDIFLMFNQQNIFIYVDDIQNNTAPSKIIDLKTNIILRN